MKLALLGYGKMGKAIEDQALKEGHTIGLKVNSKASLTGLEDCDVAIEFSTPQTAEHNIYKCFEAGIPVVVGTTGWYDQFPQIEAQCLSGGHTLFYATNFSVGVNIFFALNKHLGRIMDRFEEYDVSMMEEHHTTKLDTPSGTAITLAEGLIDNLERKKDWVRGHAYRSTEIGIISVRAPEVPGTHKIIFESDIDEIIIEHKAKGRLGFVKGALTAAKWVPNKKGVFTMNDLLKI